MRPGSAAPLPVSTTSTGLLCLSVGARVHHGRSDTEVECMAITTHISHSMCDIYATPLPMIVCLGVNDVLFGHNVSETTPVFPRSMHILFLTVNEIKICWRYNLCDA